MPLYEYSCRSCSRRFEQILFGSEKPSCPKCHGTDLVKLVSRFAVSGATSKSSDDFGGDFGDLGGDAGGGDDLGGGDLGEGGDGDFGGGFDARGGCGSCGDPRGPGSCAS
jgi:putative FmdB family regulatory protein